MADTQIPASSESPSSSLLPAKTFWGDSSLPDAFFFAKNNAAAGGGILVLFLLSLIFLERLFSPKGFNLPEYIRRRRQAWAFLFHGQEMIDKGYAQSNGMPFEVLAPEARYVFITSPKHVAEMDAAGDDVMSLQHASKIKFQPKYTMNGFEWHSIRGFESLGFVKALRTLLTRHIPVLLPKIDTLIRMRIGEFYTAHPGPVQADGSKHVPLSPLIMDLTVQCSAFAVFGEELAKNEKFLHAALHYIEETVVHAEIIRAAPGWLVPIIGRIVAYRTKHYHTLMEILVPIADERVLDLQRAKRGQKVPKYNDVIQWILECSPNQSWSGKRVIQEVLVLWFGAVHGLQCAALFGIHDLALHPEYVPPLREELAAELETFVESGQGLPLLDSFLKESSRLTVVEAQTARRETMKPFTFSDGTVVNIGDCISTPVKPVMQNPLHYPSPQQFSGFRFASHEALDKLNTHPLENSGKEWVDNDAPRQKAPSKMTDIDENWHVFGAGKISCPGRFFGVAVLKAMVGRVLMEYDVRLVEPEKPRWYTWRSFMIAYDDTLVALSPRKK